MIAVIFEVWPKAEFRDNYLELAATMRKAIEGIDGFISVERFQSIVDEGKLLSLSFLRRTKRWTSGVTWQSIEWHNRLAAPGSLRIIACALRMLNATIACLTEPRHQQTVIQRTALAKELND